MSLNMPENAWINRSDYTGVLKCLIILDIWKGFEYVTGIKYARDLVIVIITLLLL